MTKKTVLIAKLASMGDLVHLLPALTDAKHAYPDIHFDWIVDKNFAEVATWHPAVERTILTNHRKWRRTLSHKTTHEEIKHFLHDLKKSSYDCVIDAQGNLKSAFIALFAKGPKHGFDGPSIPEWGAHFLYKTTSPASKKLHAIDRLRKLFASALGYPLPTSAPNYQIDTSKFKKPECFPLDPYLLFVPLASHPSKFWSEENWLSLLKQTLPLGLPILIPSGNAEEEARAKRLAFHPSIIPLPKLPLSQVAYLIQEAKALVSLDTGLSHIAAALSTPCLTLYGPTDPSLIGTTGENQVHHHAPLEQTSPREIHQKLLQLLL